MDPKNISKNLKALRAAKSLTQPQLATQAGISTGQLGNIERGQAEPRIDTIYSIASALGVGLDALLMEPKQLNSVRFRANKVVKFRDRITTEVAAKLENYNFLENILGLEIDSKPTEIRDNLKNHCKAKNRPAKAAEICRRIFGLSDNEPIRDICGLLEQNGIKVIRFEYKRNDFFGLSVGEADGGPAVIVNTWERISVERWIFSAVHELGHLILHQDAFDFGITEEDDQQEREADSFASHFLMPEKAFEIEWVESKGLPIIERVLKVKQMFFVSYLTVLKRINDHIDLNPFEIFAKLWHRAGRESLAKHREPNGLPDSAFKEDRLAGMVCDAVEKELITLSRASDILGISLDDMRSRIKQWVA